LLALELRTLTGTQAPPARMAAKTQSAATGSLGEYTATESPGENPAAYSPLVIAEICSAASAKLNDMPPPLKKVLSGAMRAPRSK